jgi:hypothetical protein
MRWNDLRRDAAGLADMAHERLIAPGVLLVATIRRDGTPPLGPVEPLILEGDLYLSMMWRSRKASDLLRDDRVLVHSVVTTRDGTEGEVKLRGRAISVETQRCGPATATRLRFWDGSRRNLGSTSSELRSMT